MSKTRYVLSLIFLCWSLLLAYLGCGRSLTTQPTSSSSPSPSVTPSPSPSSSPVIPPLASLVLDASLVSGGNGSFPTSSCATTLWADLSGNLKNGTVACGGGGWQGIGIPSNQYRLFFDGTTSVTTPLNAQPSAMLSTTWMAWIYPTVSAPGAHNQIMSIDNYAGATNRSLFLFAGTQNFGIFHGAGAWQPTTYDVNQWQHVSVVFTNSNILFYKNGNVWAYGSAPTFSDTIQTFSIGASNNGSSERYQGHIAWVAVYSRALSAKEISDSCKALQKRFMGAICY